MLEAADINTPYSWIGKFAKQSHNLPNIRIICESLLLFVNFICTYKRSLIERTRPYPTRFLNTKENYYPYFFYLSIFLSPIIPVFEARLLHMLLIHVVLEI